ncbi:MAG: hypothetical protein M1829_001621 [Trizodia sp. TS-e1964]|nr:MAG: hypothetical protein M1829_001621 [Trizodia sp. TS-e1964]
MPDKTIPILRALTTHLQPGGKLYLCAEIAKCEDLKGLATTLFQQVIYPYPPCVSPPANKPPKLTKRQGNENEYSIEILSRGIPISSPALPADRINRLAKHDDRYPLPDPRLLEMHATVARILRALGTNEALGKALDDRGLLEGLSPDSSPDVALLLVPY